MYEYVGLVWNAIDPRQNEIAETLLFRVRRAQSGWQCAFQSPGTAIYHRGVRAGSSEAFLLKAGHGVLLGNVFEKVTNRRLTPGANSFDDAPTAAIVATHGRRLIERYWGRYVAFVVDDLAHSTCIVVDPCGGLPCLLTSLHGISILFSRPSICTNLELPPFSVNWDYIRAHVYLGGIQARECGLNEVSEIVGGECLRITGRESRRSLYWNPLQISQMSMIEDAQEATALVRRTTKACIEAWASCYEGVLLLLSGGLDSSIVLACLKPSAARSRVACLNYLTEDPDGDEREFARAAATNAGCALVERLHDPSVRLERMLDISPFVRPWNYRYHVEHSQTEADLAREHGATAVFSGGGGDQIFCNSHVHFALRDYVCNHGVGMKLGAIAWDVSRIEGRSIWSVLISGLIDAIKRTRVDLVSELSRRATLASPADILSLQRRFTPPWLEGSNGLPLGKYWQALNLSTPALFYDPLGREDGPEFVKPLRSQPLVELALRIQTYVLITGGWDRAIARRAFDRDVPAPIIRRRTKGGLGDHNVGIVQSNVLFLREMLLDGLLVREGILDRASVEETLHSNHPIAGLEFLTLEDHLSTELWARSWAKTRQRAAA